MKKLFGPAISLMDRLRFPQKMVLMAVIFSSALLAFLYLLVSEINVDIAFTEKERSGADYCQAVIGRLRKTGEDADPRKWPLNIFACRQA